MDCDCLQLWLDNDREGENICFEVIDVCTPHMRPNPEIRRAKFSSITYQNIRLAHEHLISPNELESKQLMLIHINQIRRCKVNHRFEDRCNVFEVPKHVLRQEVPSTAEQDDYFWALLNPNARFLCGQARGDRMLQTSDLLLDGCYG